MLVVVGLWGDGGDAFDEGVPCPGGHFEAEVLELFDDVVADVLVGDAPELEVAGFVAGDVGVAGG